MSKVSSNLRTNTQIRITPIRLIDQDNNQIGIVETPDAIRMASEAGLDLVEVAPKERPPVCRIMDYGKFKYNQKKNLRKHHEQVLKEVRLRPKIDDNDRKIKINRALKFLSKNDKVQFTMQFRGRERAHREVGQQILMSIVHQLGELIKLERNPSMDGRHMVMIVAPNKKEFDKIVKEGGKPTLAWILKKDIEDEHDESAEAAEIAEAAEAAAEAAELRREAEAEAAGAPTPAEADVTADADQPADSASEKTE